MNLLFICYLNSNSARVVVLDWNTVKIFHRRSKRSHQLLRASTRKAMEQGENMTPEQVRNKSEVNFRLQGGSVDVNPAQKFK